MRCYLIQGPGARRYAATAAAARETRDDLVLKLGCKKKDVMTEQTDILVAKADLLAFINLLCAMSDDKE